MTMTNQEKLELWTRVERLEEEIAEIKARLAAEQTRPAVKLEGLWKDIDITEEDIEEAKRSLFPKLDDI